jgi:glutathione S-transferase
MSSLEPLVRFYDLSGPKCWSPACWRTRYALNYKRIPYECVKLSYPAIKPTCQKLLSPDFPDDDCTVPIIEILQAPYKALNDSTPIAELLNERFTEKDGYPEIRMIEQTKKYQKDTRLAAWAVYRWIVYDVYKNALDPNDGSKEYFKRTREEDLGPLEEYLEKTGGSDEQVFEDHKVQWVHLRERMAKEDGTSEREFKFS